jgi:hypothetical protein
VTRAPAILEASGSRSAGAGVVDFTAEGLAPDFEGWFRQPGGTSNFTGSHALTFR